MKKAEVKPDEELADTVETLEQITKTSGLSNRGVRGVDLKTPPRLSAKSGFQIVTFKNLLRIRCAKGGDLTRP